MPSQWLRNLGHKASHVKLLRPLYDAQLGQYNQPLSFSSYPSDIITGDAGLGRWVASGQVDFHGKRIEIDQNQWWIGTDLQNTPFFDHLHRFDFLKDLKALGGDLGRRQARAITWAWLNDFENYHYLIWGPSLTAHRLVNWLTAYPFAFEQADQTFLDMLHNHIYRQFKHLTLAIENNQDMTLTGRFEALWAIVILSTHCPALSSSGQFDTWLILFKGAMEDVFFEDGGLITYSFTDLMNALVCLSITKQSLSQAGHHPPPLWLTKQIEASLRFLSATTHSDKNTACFNSAVEDGKQTIEKLNRLASIRMKRQDFQSEESGYSALRKGKTSVIVSHGSRHSPSPNAFEMSHSAHRLIVSCGSHFYDQEWQKALNTVQAYSTLSINDTQPFYSKLKTHMETMNKACLWSGTHSGYGDDHGVTHTRRLYLDPDGLDFRGEDIVVRAIATKPITSTIRFHLHPKVKTSMVNDQSSVLMQLPNGNGWIFEASGAYISTDESIYFGGDGMTPRKTSQIVLSADIEGITHHVKWAIRRA